MKAFKIEVADSDYPYLVIAPDVKEAVLKLEERLTKDNAMRHVEIVGVRKLDYSDFQIVL